ncbi:MAG: hypothetical protein AAFY17_10120 [Cyanobacteria bacterium J06642_11]
MRPIQSLTRYILVPTLLTSIVASCELPREYSVDEWWQRVIEVDADNFTDIQHFTIQGIDFSHHFRFAFSDRADLDVIIRQHGLTPDADPIQFFSDPVPNWPEWFEPPDHAEAYSNGGSDPSIVIWIDDENQLAYFEFVKI